MRQYVADELCGGHSLDLSGNAGLLAAVRAAKEEQARVYLLLRGGVLYDLSLLQCDVPLLN